jgi:leucyl-tRNA synthetase
MGPLADSKPWNPRDITGCRRFIDRAWRLIVDPDGHDPVRPELRVDQQRELAGETLELERQLNRAIARVDDSFKSFNFNTAIAALMSFVNEAFKRPNALSRGQAERFVLALAPFAPHMCEELWQRLGNAQSLVRAPWPTVIAEFLVDDETEYIVQVNGKLRGKARVAKDAAQADVESAARLAVPTWVDGKQVLKTVFVPGRLINLIVK